MQVPGGYLDELSHTPVCMNSKDGDIFPAVRFASSHSLIQPEIKIGFQSTFISGFKVANCLSYPQDFYTQLVTEYPGIGEKGLFPPKSMDICATDADTVDLEQGFFRQ